MFMFKKSFLTVLLAAISIFAFSGVAQANQIDGLTNGTALIVQPTGLSQYVNPGGLGDALIYGYYNARGSYDYLRVINTSLTSGISAKVRFREGDDSNEILDFFICLSAGDQWSAWIIGDDSPSTVGTLVWYDNDTPTYPDPNVNNDATDNFMLSVPFHYSATGAAAAVSADDTKEGYAEIIAVNAWPDVPGAAKVVKTPDQCRAQLALSGPTLAGFPVQGTVQAPNVLAGNLYIFDLADGAGTYAYNATAIANFADILLATSLATDNSPRLSDSSPDVNANGTGIDEINYILTKDTEYFIYDVETSLTGGTTIINTFPTKRTTINLMNLMPAINGPFNDLACLAGTGEIGTLVGASCVTTITTKSELTNGRCEKIGVIIYDDAENSPTTTTGFSPGTTTTLSKCNEVNVIVVGDSGAALLDTNLLQFNIATSGFQLGWVGIDMSNGTKLTSLTTLAISATSHGLPAIAYELQGFADGYFTHMLPARHTTQITNP